MTADPVVPLIASWRRSLIAAGKSPRTLEGYLGTAGQFTRWCATNGRPTYPTEQTRADVEEFIGELLATKARGTAALRFRNLRAWFAWLVTEGELGASPMVGMRQPTVDAKPVPVLTEAQLSALLDTCRNGKDFLDRRDHALLRVLIDTGMRRGELAALELGDVDLEGPVLIIRRSKTYRGRLVPLGSRTAAAVDRYIRARARHRLAASPALWLGQRGPLSGEGVRQMVLVRARQAGLDGVFVHQFRHSFAHHWLSNGGQEHDAAAIAGWSSTTMLARYGASAASERAREAHKRLGMGDRL
jgi:site-specific recombinase XerD